MFAVGKCWKKDGWIISMYKRIGDPYITVKVKKAKVPAQERTESKSVNDFDMLEYETLKALSEEKGNI